MNVTLNNLVATLTDDQCEKALKLCRLLTSDESTVPQAPAARE